MGLIALWQAIGVKGYRGRVRGWSMIEMTPLYQAENKILRQVLQPYEDNTATEEKEEREEEEEQHQHWQREYGVISEKYGEGICFLSLGVLYMIEHGGMVRSYRDQVGLVTDHGWEDSWWSQELFWDGWKGRMIYGLMDSLIDYGRWKGRYPRENEMKKKQEKKEEEGEEEGEEVEVEVDTYGIMKYTLQRSVAALLVWPWYTLMIRIILKQERGVWTGWIRLMNEYFIEVEGRDGLLQRSEERDRPRGISILSILVPFTFYQIMYDCIARQVDYYITQSLLPRGERHHQDSDDNLSLRKKTQKKNGSLLQHYFPGLVGYFVGKSAAILFLYPWTTILHRLMAQGKGRTFSSFKSSPYHYHGFFHAIKQVWQEGGVKAFYAGINHTLGRLFVNALLLQIAEYVYLRWVCYLQHQHSCQSPSSPVKRRILIN